MLGGTSSCGMTSASCTAACWRSAASTPTAWAVSRQLPAASRQPPAAAFACVRGMAVAAPPGAEARDTLLLSPGGAEQRFATRQPSTPFLCARRGRRGLRVEEAGAVQEAAHGQAARRHRPAAPGGLQCVRAHMRCLPPADSCPALPRPAALLLQCCAATRCRRCCLECTRKQEPCLTSCHVPRPPARRYRRRAQAAHGGGGVQPQHRAVRQGQALVPEQGAWPAGTGWLALLGRRSRVLPRLPVSCAQAASNQPTFHSHAAAPCSPACHPPTTAGRGGDRGAGGQGPGGEGAGVQRGEAVRGGGTAPRDGRRRRRAPAPPRVQTLVRHPARQRTRPPLCPHMPPGLRFSPALPTPASSPTRCGPSSACCRASSCTRATLSAPLMRVRGSWAGGCRVRGMHGFWWGGGAARQSARRGWRAAAANPDAVPVPPCSGGSRARQGDPRLHRGPPHKGLPAHAPVRGLAAALRLCDGVGEEEGEEGDHAHTGHRAGPRSQQLACALPGPTPATALGAPLFPPPWQRWRRRHHADGGHPHHPVRAHAEPLVRAAGHRAQPPHGARARVPTRLLARSGRQQGAQRALPCAQGPPERRSLAGVRLGAGGQQAPAGCVPGVPAAACRRPAASAPRCSAQDRLPCPPAGPGPAHHRDAHDVQGCAA